MDKKMMEKLMSKKKDGELDPKYKDAKMSMLQALHDEMSKMMGDDLKGQSMKKVEVASNDEEGLKHGLDKAKELLGKNEENVDPTDDDGDYDGDNEGIEDHDPYSPEHDAEDSEESEEDEGEEQETLADIEKKLQDLMDKKQKLTGKK